MSVDGYRAIEYGLGVLGFIMVLGWLGIIAVALLNNDIETTLILVVVTLLIIRVAVKEVVDI